MRSTWQLEGTANVVLPIGDTVYIGGEFTALYDESGGRVMRNNLAAIDRRTGEPTDFNPDMNKKVFALAPSQDGSTLYVGGTFTTSGGVNRKRLAAFDVATGELTDFSPPAPNGSLRAIATDGTTMYIGGLFDKVGGVERPHLAAYDIATETLDADWAPVASDRVTGIIVDPTKIWVAGDFRRIDGVLARGLSALDPDDGELFETEHPTYPVIAIAAQGNRIFVAGGGPGGRAASYNRRTGNEQWTIASDGNFQGVSAIGDYAYFGGHYERVEGVPVGRMTRHDIRTGELDTSWLPLVNGLRSVNSVATDADHVYIGGDFKHVARQRHRGFAMFD